MIPPRQPEGRPTRPVVIGLTGPIGCGKSSVARMLADVGGAVIDADALAREVTVAGSPALPEIRVAFGDTVFEPSGELDRGALAEIVFSDPAALERLERITHPRVRLLVEQALDRAAAEGVPFVVVEAIKLVEGGLAERCDEVWVIDCAPETQRSRLADRGVAQADADRRVEAQGEDLAGRLVARLRKLDVTSRRLSSEGSLDETRERAEDALAEALDRRVG